MIKNDAPIGKNRTGIEVSPLDKHDVLEIPGLTRPSSPADGAVLARARADYIAEAGVIGSVPPPASIKGVAATGTAAVKGVNVAVLIDKLGERLAFERTGVRLYEALITKCGASDPLPYGPTVGDLEKIRAEELGHFELLRDALESLGADPTAVTPSADVASVLASGVIKVVSDSRTSMKQSLEAILVAELIDNASWSQLIELTRRAGHDAMAEQFEAADAREEEHLHEVDRWLTRALVAAQKPVTRR